MKKKFLMSVLVFTIAFACVLSGFSVFADTAPEEQTKLYEAGDEALVKVESVLTTDPYNDDTPIFKVTITNNVFENDVVDAKITFTADKLGLGVEEAVVGEVTATNSKIIKINLPEDTKIDDKPFISFDLTYKLKDANDVVLPDGETVYLLSYTDVLNVKANSPKEVVKNFLNDTGFTSLFGSLTKGLSGEGDDFENFVTNYGSLVMIIISFVLMYLAIAKGFEPLLLLPIAFGMLLTNLPGAEMFHEELFMGGHVHWDLFSSTAGLLDFLYLGVKLGIYPCLIFLGVGAMTDFGPLIANPKSLLLGAAAQFGIFATYIGATLLGFTSQQASSIGIIGGADGPTAIFVTSKLAPELLGPIAVAAYSYMALVPVIQPPIMRALTTKKERMIVMKPLRTVSKKEKIVFPIVVTVFVALLVPSAAPLVGCLMLGNLFKESGVCDRLSKTAQNELMNIVTIFLGTTVGATATATTFLSVKTLMIMGMGIVAFSMGSAAGVLLAKFMNLFLKTKINPLIGSAGVSAVPMAARVSQTVGQKENPKNFLLMHAMGPNVAGVIGSAIAAGVLLALFG